MKKVILSLGVLAILMALVAVPALAAEAINDDTGENSENWAIAIEANFDVALNNNSAGLMNFTGAIANTGFNEITGEDENTIDTGSAGAGANTTNWQNTNLTSFDNSVDGGSASASNLDTGDNSENWAIALDADVAVVWNKNNAKLCNFTVALANTGFNSIGNGADDGNQINTGSAGATANTTNVQNTNITSISGVGGGSGSVTAKNEDTGTDSLNVAGAGSIQAVVVLNDNDARLFNATVAVANTGVNEISGDDDNAINTGSANAEANTTNIQNTNVTEVNNGGFDGVATAGVMPDGNGTQAANTDTGENSENIAVAADVDATVVLNDNEADAMNVTASVANSGANDVSGDDGNTVTTGDATATSNTTNAQNTNVTSSGGVSCFPSIPGCL